MKAARGVLFSLVLGLLGAGPPSTKRDPVPVEWTRPAPLYWPQCKPGSTLTLRHLPAGGGAPFVEHITRMRPDDDFRAELRSERVQRDGTRSKHCCSMEFEPSFWGEGAVLSRQFLRRDVLEVDGKRVDVEVTQRISTAGGGFMCGNRRDPCAGIKRVEEMWRRVGAPPAEGPLRIRVDLKPWTSGEAPSSCRSPSKREPDADGMVDIRLALALDVKVVIDERVHDCIRVRTWSDRRPTVDAVECPSVLGGYAMFQRGSREDVLETLEVISFKCRMRK
ncbi:hypothetical protein F0U60_42410 [Archangium minus]|uniref:Lipoprotein n=1 Tax=Archangium minus TaxID=83450 RepID=A0ABY9X3W0_9BACT|nr:hypothetical protein F0U60_42410 [Archangium minus]